MRSGVLFRQEIYPEHKPQVFADPFDIKAWKRAERSSPLGPGAIRIPVRHSSNDPLTEHRLKALVIVRYDRKAENAARMALTQNSSVFRAVTAYLASQLEFAAMASLAGSHQRLTSLRTKLVVSADLCYQVAHAITKHLSFVGWCGVYRIRRSAIEAVSVLPSWSDRLKTAELSKKTPVLIAGTTYLFSPQEPSSVRAFLHSGNQAVASIGKSAAESSSKRMSLLPSLQNISELPAILL